jgi:hypothetical protein
MNIFRLDNDPQLAAEMAIDKHIVKMPVETAQLLHTALRQHGLDQDWLYKPFNPKHPSCLWVTESRFNFMWLVRHGMALCTEYTRRYGKVHKCQSLIEKSGDFSSLISDIPSTPMRLAMPDQFRTDDPVHSYRLYYAGAKFRFAKWKTNEPYWWDEYRHLVIFNKLEVANEKDDGVKVV